MKILLLILLLIPSLANAQYEITRITNNDYSEGIPEISGNKLTWLGQFTPLQKAIFMYDGSQVSQISSIARYYSRPQIDGNNIVWQSQGSSYYDLNLYNGTSISKIVTSKRLWGFDEGDFDVKDGKICWREFDGSDYEIYLYDGVQTTQITDDSEDNHSPKISGNNLVWVSRSGNFEYPFFYDGTNINLMYSNAPNPIELRLSGNNVAWVGNPHGSLRAVVYLSTDPPFQHQGIMTNYPYNNFDIEMSGTNVVWCGGDGTDNEIFFYNGTTTVTLTDNAYDDRYPDISGENIVWCGYDGSDSEIYLYDGKDIIQITDNDYDDILPKIDENTIAWVGYPDGDSPTSSEIFMARPVPEPSVFLLFGWSLFLLFKKKNSAK